MHIDIYDFGRMVIDGKHYSSDVVLLPDGRIIGNWRRTQGHELAVEDLRELPGTTDCLVIGTGMYGRMDVPQETVRYLKEQGIEVLIDDTKLACQLYNVQAGKEGIAGAFHLAC